MTRKHLSYYTASWYAIGDNKQQKPQQRSAANPMISVTDELGDQHMLADSISPYSEADDADSEPLDSIPALINADHLQKTVS